MPFIGDNICLSTLSFRGAMTCVIDKDCRFLINPSLKPVFCICLNVALCCTLIEQDLDICLWNTTYILEIPCHNLSIPFGIFNSRDTLFSIIAYAYYNGKIIFPFISLYL